MREFKIPSEVSFVLDKINEYGYESYLVGGCVRDYLLGKTPSDFDVTTNARPETIIEIFKDSAHLVATGLKHGTVTVIKDHVSVEVTTYRVDGDYSDNRHPEVVRFSPELKEDVLRRDFTINSMAYSPKHGFKDHVNGLDDLDNGVIRCVGDPAVRFEEDSLRILRALRFSSILGFEIEENTSSQIHKKAHLLENISIERITTEFIKLLCGEYSEKILLDYRDVFTVFVPKISEMFDFEQHTPYHKYDVYTHSVKAVAAADKEDKILRTALYFHDIGKPECFFTDSAGVGHFYGHAQRSMEITDEIMKKLRFDNNFRSYVVTLIKYHDAPIENDEKRIKKLLRNLGEEQFFRLIALQRADNAAQSEIVFHRKSRFDAVEETAKRILAEKACFSLADLAVNGNDLISLGIPKGKLIGRILNDLLENVIENRIPNDKNSLLQKAAEYKGE
ncbi:MAG: HD domain-containing protein [Ruminococcaceae bacterium]|nr:HD domain-containing protein [Oscillospiraceae bacterium]